MKRARFPRRRGATTIDYILILAVIFPITMTLFYMLIKALKAFYYFSSITLGWLVY